MRDGPRWWERWLVIDGHPGGWAGTEWVDGHVWIVAACPFRWMARLSSHPGDRIIRAVDWEGTW